MTNLFQNASCKRSVRRGHHRVELPYHASCVLCECCISCPAKARVLKKPAGARVLKKPAGAKSAGKPEAMAKKKAEKPRKANSPSTHHLAHPPCCMPSTQTYPLRAWDRSPPALGTVPRPWAQCHTYPWERSPPPLGTAPCLFTGFLAAGKKVKMLEQPTMSKAAIERMK